MDTNAVSYTLTPETAGSCPFAEPAPGCSPLFEEEGERVVAELEKLLAASAATWKVRKKVADRISGFRGTQQPTRQPTPLLRSLVLLRS